MIFNWWIFLFGIVIGIIITILLVWLFYSQRWIIFSNCNNVVPICNSINYFNDPTDALKNNPNLKPSDILMLNSNGTQLIYKRVPKISNCMPGSDQNIVIDFPEVCQFSDSTGETLAAQRGPVNVTTLSIDYKANNFTIPQVKKNCVNPFPSNPVKWLVNSGKPTTQWPI